MIEAVHSVVASAPLLRSGAGRQVEPVEVKEELLSSVSSSQGAPYISPFIHVDNTFDRAVLQIRDSETGDVVRQIPSEEQLKAYRRATQSEEAVAARAERSRQAEASIEKSSSSESAETTQTTQSAAPSEPSKGETPSASSTETPDSSSSES